RRSPVDAPAAARAHLGAIGRAHEDDRRDRRRDGRSERRRRDVGLATGCPVIRKTGQNFTGRREGGKKNRMNSASRLTAFLFKTNFRTRRRVASRTVRA